MSCFHPAGHLQVIVRGLPARFRFLVAGTKGVSGYVLGGRRRLVVHMRDTGQSTQRGQPTLQLGGQDAPTQRIVQSIEHLLMEGSHWVLINVLLDRLAYNVRLLRCSLPSLVSLLPPLPPPFLCPALPSVAAPLNTTSKAAAFLLLLLLRVQQSTTT